MSDMVKDTLVHIADLHFWEIVWNPLRLLNKRLLGNVNVLFRRHKEFLMDRADAYADAVAATGAPSALLTGDFTSTSTDAEFAMSARFAEGLAKRGLRVIAIPGNHDVYTFEAARKHRFERYLGAYLPPSGLPACIDLPGGTPLVLAPTVAPNLLSSRGRIRRAEADAVGALLEGCPPGPVIVAGHYPILERTYAYHSTWGRRLANAKALHDALQKARGPLLYVAGHVHRFSYVRDPRLPAAHHVTTPAFFLQRHGKPEQGAFTVVRALEQGFEVISHVYAGNWRQEPATPREII